MPSDRNALSAGGGRQGPRPPAAAAGHVALDSAGPEAWLEDSAGSLTAEAETQALLHDIEVTNSGSARGSKPPVSVPAAPSPSPRRRAPLRRLVSKFTLRSELGDESWEVYQHEAKRLAQLAIPLSGSHFFNFALSLISVAFIGRLGEFELSVAVLATSMYNVTGLSIVSGFVGAQETLAGQAFGARSYRTVGVVLQRAVLLTILLWALVCGLWTQAERLMLAMGQDAAISAGAQRFLLLSMPALGAAGLFEVLKRHLMAQNVVRPSIVASCVATSLAPIYSYALVFWLGWGLDGAALAMDLAQLTMLCVLALWALHYDRSLLGTPQQTWHGWSRDALRGWGGYLQLALPSTAMICMEWWTFELCILMSGWLPNPHLTVSVMGLCMNTTAAMYMFPLGLGSAVSVRVSNALGAGLPHSAQRAAHTTMVLAALCQATLMAFVFASSGWWGRLFTDVEEVVRTAAGVFPVLALTLPGDGLNCVLSGLLRGAGRQALGACLNLVTYWGFGLPLAALLAFKAGWGILGMWSALAIVTSVQACLMSTIVLRFDWEREAQRAADSLEHTAPAEPTIAAPGVLHEAELAFAPGLDGQAWREDSALLMDGKAAPARAAWCAPGPEDGILQQHHEV